MPGACSSTREKDEPSGAVDTDLGAMARWGLLGVRPNTHLLAAAPTVTACSGSGGGPPQDGPADFASTGGDERPAAVLRVPLGGLKGPLGGLKGPCGCRGMLAETTPRISTPVLLQRDQG